MVGCSSLAPALTGLLFAYRSHEAVSIILLCVNTLAVIALYVFMSHLYNAWPALGQKVGVDVLEASDILNNYDLESLEDDEDYDLDDTAGVYGSVGTGSGVPTGRNRLSVRSAAEAKALLSRRVSTEGMRINTSTAAAAAGDTVTHSTLTRVKAYCGQHCCSVSSVFSDFYYSGCVGMMVSYSFLYLTVLSFGSLMTVYTRYCGVTDDMVGLFRGLSALSGYLGALLFPWASDALGLYNAAQVAIVYQFVLVAVAASSFFWAEVGVSVYVVIGAVVRNTNIYYYIHSIVYRQ